jgi:hypothetical protein
MQTLKGKITGVKSRYSTIGQDLVGTNITIMLEEKNDVLLWDLVADKIFNESPLVLQVKPILK